MECLRRMKQYKDKGEDPKKIGIMVASHNEDTVRFAIEKYVSQNILYKNIFKLLCMSGLNTCTQNCFHSNIQFPRIWIIIALRIKQI